MPSSKTNKGTLGFEQTISRLESIKEEMNDPATELEHMISLYEEGLKLVRRGRKILSEAELRIQTLELKQKKDESTLTPDSEENDEFTLL